MFRLATLIASIALIFIFLSSCEHDAELVYTPGVDSLICFDSQVLPIIVSNCSMAGCHDGSEQFALLNYQDIKNKVTAGDPNKSELYKAMVPNKWTKKTFMPPSPQSSLNNTQITIVQLWIMEGAKPCNN